MGRAYGINVFGEKTGSDRFMWMCMEVGFRELTGFQFFLYAYCILGFVTTHVSRSRLPPARVGLRCLTVTLLPQNGTQA